MSSLLLCGCLFAPVRARQYMRGRMPRHRGDARRASAVPRDGACRRCADAVRSGCNVGGTINVSSTGPGGHRRIHAWGRAVPDHMSIGSSDAVRHHETRLVRGARPARPLVGIAGATVKGRAGDGRQVGGPGKPPLISAAGAGGKGPAMRGATVNLIYCPGKYCVGRPRSDGFQRRGFPHASPVFPDLTAQDGNRFYTP